MKYTGNIQKMLSQLNDTVQYHLPVGDEKVDMNALLDREIQFSFHNTINCIHCGRKTNKSFSQGFCYPCFQSLAQCDICIIKPEKCHYNEGTCREPEWGKAFCLQAHYVYLANSSGLKVGITRGTQIPTRWIDQGASQAIPFFKVKNRLLSGQLEVLFKNHVADKTSWQKMLKGKPENIDMISRRNELYDLCKASIDELSNISGHGAIEYLEYETPVDINFPVIEYPVKVKSLNFDKTHEVNGKLNGIKGQYLIFNTGVLNMRKFAGYKLDLEV